MSQTRRQALKVTAISALSYSRILGANDKVRMGLIGCGDRGQHVMETFLSNQFVDVAGFCDVYPAKMDQARGKARVTSDAKDYSEHKALLDRKDIDVTLIATPDHWHSTIAIDALNAGKDVYVEKPLTLKPEEGPPIVKAARVNERVCQVGMQQRSGKHYLQAKAEYIDSGKLGTISLCRTWWHGNSYHLRKAPQNLQSKPSNLNWARFLGPVKWRDYDPQQYFNWRAYLDFGGGQVTDLFTHWIDVVHMFMGQDVPISAQSAGGIYVYKDGRTAPDTINVLLQYPKDYTATFEATLVPGITGEAIEICGTEGRLLIDRRHFDFFAKGRNVQPVTVQAEPGKPPVNDSLTQAHVNNFLDCVKSRKLPNGDVLIGHRSAQASHLGNISYMQRRRIDFDPIREEILPL